MAKSKKEKDAEDVKIFLILILIGIAITAIVVFFQMVEETQGAELWGAFTGLVIVVGLCGGIIYSLRYKSIQEEKKKEKLFNEEIKLKREYNEKEEKLKNLHKKGILSDTEYSTKIKNLRDSQFEVEIQKTEEFQQLQFLYQSGLLTKEELESKLLTLRNQRIRKEKGFTDRNLSEHFSIAGNFSNGLAKVVGSDLNYGFIDMSGNIVVDIKFEHAEDFSEDLAAVRLGNKFGFIDKRGRTIISLVYDDASSFHDGKAKVSLGKERFKINKLGKRISD